jgi:hypothetical protein
MIYTFEGQADRDLPRGRGQAGVEFIIICIFNVGGMEHGYK